MGWRALWQELTRPSMRGAESHVDGLWLGLQSGKRKVSPSGEAGRGQTPRENTNQISDGSGYIFS